MGEIADMMLDGTMDPETGEFNFDGEDGPGFPMTAAQAAEFQRETGFRGHQARGQHRGKPLFGLWREIALALRAGHNTHMKIRDAVPEGGRAVHGQVDAMIRAHLIDWSGRILVLSGKGEEALGDD